MYFAVGWPDILRVNHADVGELLVVCSSCDHQLFATLSSRVLGIWLSKPRVLVTSYTRSDQSLLELGENKYLLWNTTNEGIVVSTTKNRLLIFRLDGVQGSYDFNADQNQCSIPTVTLSHTNVVPVPVGISCVMRIADGIGVAMEHGIQLFNWDSEAVKLIQIPGLDNKRDADRDCAAQIISVDYRFLLHGFALVLTGGHVAFFSSAVGTKQACITWLDSIKDAVIVRLNSRYCLLAIGLKSGRCVIYRKDEDTGKLEFSHTLSLSGSDYPDVHLGPVQCMEWSPDGFVLAVTWQGCGMAVWSVFGTLLYCSLSNDHQHLPSWDQHNHLDIFSLTWASSGFHLLFLVRDNSQDKTSNGTTAHDVYQLSFIRSALCTNPCFSNQKHLVLFGEDRILLHPGESLLRSQTVQSEPAMPDTHGISRVPNIDQHQSLVFKDGNSPPSLVLGTAAMTTMLRLEESLRGMEFAQLQRSQLPWQVLQVPPDYLNANWPIRYVAVSENSGFLAVAGLYGLAHCNVSTQRWKLFGNVSQESAFQVQGGLVWWRDMLVVPCQNLSNGSDEIRLYPQSANLDNSHVALTLRVPSRVHLVNLYLDCLCVATVDCRLHFFGLQIDSGSVSGSTIRLQTLPELSLVPYVPHISQLIALLPTSMDNEVGPGDPASNESSALPRSLVANVSGRVLLLARDVCTVKAGPNTNPPMTPFCRPVVLASSVENMWASCLESCQHLQQALWLSCGASGMKVWLPLFPNTEERQASFLSKRIMLKFDLDIYPLAVCFEDAVVIGAAQRFKEISVLSCSSPACHLFPFLTVERTVQIYLHHILCKLLRRNALAHTEVIAKSCTGLPYFPHMLELMLHEVLEEEAANQPASDALLPKVVAFVKRFPHFLEVIGRCARKTEVALWRHLFSHVGNPEELFSMCLERKQLDMAASYLIIIQNMEAPKVSRQHATRLLNAALSQRSWTLAKDLVRFLRTIASEPSPMSPTSSMPPLWSLPSSASSSDAAEPSSPDAQHPRHVRAPSDDWGMSFVRPVFTTNDVCSSREEYFIDVILARHARKLLAGCHLRDLGRFAASLDFPLKAWLSKERYRVGRVENYVQCFKELHADFQWPLHLLHLCNSVGPGGQMASFGHSSSGLDGFGDTDFQSRSIHAHSLEYSLPLQTSSMVRSTDVNAVMNFAPQSFTEISLHTIQSPADGGINIDDVTLSGNSVHRTVSASELDGLEFPPGPEAHNGPKQSERELKYLLAIFLNAGCLDWALLLSVILRDVAAMKQLVVLASESCEANGHAEMDILTRVVHGLHCLRMWSADNCPAYLLLLDVMSQQWKRVVAAVSSRHADTNIPVQEGESSVDSPSTDDGVAEDGQNCVVS